MFNGLKAVEETASTARLSTAGREAERKASSRSTDGIRKNAIYKQMNSCFRLPIASRNAADLKDSFIAAVLLVLRTSTGLEFRAR